MTLGRGGRRTERPRLRARALLALVVAGIVAGAAAGVLTGRLGEGPVASARAAQPAPPVRIETYVIFRCDVGGEVRIPVAARFRPTTIPRLPREQRPAGAWVCEYVAVVDFGVLDVPQRPDLLH
jgi:hypothetical protein